MAILHRPDLADRTFKELYDGLPEEHKRGVDRIRWCFNEKLLNMPGVDQSSVLEFDLTKDDLRLLYDPILPEALRCTLSEEDQELALASIDPVVWVRQFLRYEPRVYQILMLRGEGRIKGYRCGRRSGKSTSMVWEASWFAYVNPGVKVMIICPLEAQIKLMWDMFDEMMLHSGIRPLKAAHDAFGVVSKIRKPWEIHFSNGSIIKGFTSGARSGGKADSVRGNEAHLIIVDEMDLMMPDDLNAITSMLQTTSDEWVGEKRLVVSSTPNGRRDMFYVHCHSKSTREYWFPSFVNPYFSPKDEEEQRELLTEAGFIHEIVADWGAQTTGVFKPSLLNAVANEEYSYWNERRVRGPIICGVDWDKYGAGVNIVVVANVDGVLELVHREEIERAQYEYTLGAGVERVKQLDERFNFSYVYCDRGYGEFQWETLVKDLPYGDQRVIGKNFSSSVLETNPVTGVTEKEEFKPFMVENAVNLYEKRQVKIPSNDQKFISQLLGYVQLRMSATGRPVFGSMDAERIGDHALDAWMMALLGHTEQYGDLITKFERITPRVVNTNNALNPEAKITDRNKAQHALMGLKRPMTSLSRNTSVSVFNRPEW